MKRAIIAAIVILLVSPCYAEKISAITSEISRQLHDQLRRYRPFIEIRTKFNTITVSHRTFHAAVHGIDKTGKIDHQVTIVEGPNVDGFYIDIRHREGKYNGAASYPQDFKETYWSRYFNVYDLGDSHIVINYSYGKQTNKDVKEIVVSIIETTINERE